MAVIVSDAELPRRGLLKAIFKFTNKDSGKLMLPVFTDSDLAERAIAYSNMPGACVLELNSKKKIRELVEEFIDNGGEHIAIDHIADGRSIWHTVDANKFLRSFSE